MSEQRYNWQEVADREPKGYVEFNDGKTATHGPVESVTIDDIDMVNIRLKWRAQVPLGGIGLPDGDWTAVANDDPIVFPNFVVPFVVEETPEKGPRVRFATTSILYFNQVDGLDPAKVVGLEL